jgi:hypothetical protein
VSGLARAGKEEGRIISFVSCSVTCYDV